VTRYDDVLTVLKDERFAKDYSSRMRWVPRPIQPLNRNLLNLDPPDHTRLRTLVTKAFTPRVVERRRDRIQEVCNELLDAAATSGRMDIVGRFALLVPLTIIADLLGIPAQDRRRFYSWSKRVAAATSGAIFDLMRAQPALWLSMGYFRRLIALRRAVPRDDFLTALLRAEEAGDGSETTMSLIASGALALIQHPQQRELLQQNSALAQSAIEELLRYTSPADFATFRIAREDVTIGAVTIPRGDVVLAALASANRDESQFPDPEILREPNRHLAFGVGAHFCLGAPLARLEGQIALTTLFRRFPDLRLAKAAETLRWRRGLLLRGLEQLPVVLGGPSNHVLKRTAYGWVQTLAASELSEVLGRQTAHRVLATYAPEAVAQVMSP